VAFLDSAYLCVILIVCLQSAFSRCHYACQRIIFETRDCVEWLQWLALTGCAFCSIPAVFYSGDSDTMSLSKNCEPWILQMTQLTYVHHSVSTHLALYSFLLLLR